MVIWIISSHFSPLSKHENTAAHTLAEAHAVQVIARTEVIPLSTYLKFSVTYKDMS